jgi:hypothetical protein
MTDSKFKYYLHDLGLLLKIRALEAKRAKRSDFQDGRLFAFNEVISIMQQQAEGFQIPLKEIQLDDIEPDKDLI